MHFRKLRRFLFEGLAVIGPVGLSVWVLVWLFRRLDRILGQYIDPVLGWSAPGAGLVILLLLLLVTGWITERALGARVVDWWGDLMARVPVASQVYRGSRRIVQTVFGENRIAFKEVVAFQWPDEDRWGVGFVTGPAPEELHDKLGDDAVTIYMPTAPNPASGYLIMVERARLLPIEATVEEAFTFILSAGSVPVGQAGDLLERTERRGTGDGARPTT